MAVCDWQIGSRRSWRRLWGCPTGHNCGIPHCHKGLTPKSPEKNKKMYIILNYTPVYSYNLPVPIAQGLGRPLPALPAVQNAAAWPAMDKLHEFGAPGHPINIRMGWFTENLNQKPRLFPSNMDKTIQSALEWDSKNHGYWQNRIENGWPGPKYTQKWPMAWILKEWQMDTNGWSMAKKFQDRNIRLRLATFQSWHVLTYNFSGYKCHSPLRFSSGLR